MLLLCNIITIIQVTKEWRVIAKYLQENPNLVNSKSSFDCEPHPLSFDEQQHKSLVAELKQLYTAITRAKSNLWIYDSDETKRLPMFDYWNKRGLVKVVKVNEIDHDNMVITKVSSPEEWKKLGDTFKRERLWEPAVKCYKRAGRIDLENEAKAFYFYKQAIQKHSQSDSEALYVKAALAFLNSDRAHHNQKLLVWAAKCLKNAKKYTEAGTLYCMLKRVSKTITIYHVCH